jgi:hypothetical protein
MSKGHSFIALAAVLTSSVVLAAGCIDAVAEYYTPLTDPNLFDGGPDADSGPPPGCIPSENVDPVADSCGVFVSSSMGNDTSGKGTKEAPFATLTKALAATKGKPVYACGEVFDKETVAIAESAILYGALDCVNNWKYDASKKTQLAPTAEGIALTISKATTSAEVYDFAITSADATQDGGSSIAVLVAQSAASFTRCDVTAGSGKAGAPGATQPQVMTPTSANGKDGTDDAMCNVPVFIAGGAGGTNTCGGTKTDGGNGGKGYADVIGGPGGDGLPMMTPGNGGSGQTKTAACNVSDPKGAAGNVGTGGTGARGIGDVSTSGYQGPTPALGGPGTPGQGGGGGGGALACDPPTNSFAGPSGGGGGAGGCGGAPGNPGQSGGSSIGLLSLGAKLTLSTVTITAKSGGGGGLGGDGQIGGNGGLAGHAIGGAACDGGKGGQGGAGGPGGGGAGGHSIAIAIKGGKLPDLGSATIHHEAGASGGAGGDMDMSAQTRGDDGLGCKALDFADATSCVK